MTRSAVIALVLLGACSRGEDPALAAAKARLARSSYEAPALGLRVSFLHAGESDGRTIVFVHGTPGSAEGWADYLVGVPKGLRYVAVDRPGFGQSWPGTAVTSLQDQAQALVPLLRTDRPPILVGHSLGAPIIALLAAGHPDQVGGLILLAGALDPARERIHWYQPIRSCCRSRPNWSG
jgi:pimeloyl-ACP methyl ester carboxylesterase